MPNLINKFENIPHGTTVNGKIGYGYGTNSVDARHSQHVSSDYERIRVVGKGSFGMAVLYRRKDDDSLVILKEINLHELSSNERHLALNEVALLARLHHPHIISYYDSFEENGVLMIEMEFADGGTLAQFLSRQNDLIPESDVIFMFVQMACAVSYLHDNNILHRDLKTANIFLTTDNMVKVGDFGISKRMGTGTKFQGAQTILGTPYYLSPEMCKGYSYNEKSDIWALGCCLYEMVCLRKTFDGTSLPILVNKIVHAEYEHIKGPYSNQLKLLLREMLRTEPEQRPTACRVLEIVQRHQNQFRRTSPSHSSNHGDSNEGSEVAHPRPFNTRSRETKGASYSAIYRFDVTNVTLTVVPTMPAKLKVKQLAIGKSHQLLLTSDFQVYSWGANEHGQLGHNDRNSRSVPTRIEALIDRSVSKIAAGKNFSVFCADQGIVVSCGDARFMADESVKKDWLRPKIIDSLLRENVIDLACGEEHVVALCESGEVLAWGRGELGQLGIGSCEDAVIPTRVTIPRHQLISNVKCGPDCTLFITSLGTIMVTGSNRNNKLNLNRRIGVFANVKNNEQNEVKCVYTPTVLKAFPARVIDASLGQNHSGVLLENGRIYLFGNNLNGELGTGNRYPVNHCTAWKPMKALQDKTCVQLICGDGFTMAATADNELYFWGLRGTLKNSSGQNYDEVTIKDIDLRTAEERRSSSQDSPLAKTPKKAWQWSRNNSSTGPASPVVPEQAVVITQPTLVLRLDVKRSNSASASNRTSSLTIRMSSLMCNRRTVIVVIDTSPASNKSHFNNYKNSVTSTRLSQRRESAPEVSIGNVTCNISNWLRKELDGCDDPTAHNKHIEEQMGTIHSPVRYASKEEESLVDEIRSIKRNLENEQNTTTDAYKQQIHALEDKLSELQTLQLKSAEVITEPTYPMPRILKNPYLPEIQTKVCSIL